MRKVEFRIQQYPPIMIVEGSEEERKNKIRTGYFHQWGAELVSGADETTMVVTKGVIEEEGTKEVFLIHPEYIKFLE